MKLCELCKVAALDLAQQTVMLSPVLTEQEPDPAQDIAQVRVIETKTDKQERLRDEITLKCHGKQMPRGRVCLVVIFRDNRLVRCCDTSPCIL